jgi:mannosyltransferase
MIEKVKDAGLSDRIHFVNERPLDQMADAYRDLSIYVAPSHLEGFGLTVAEALSSGVPTIATRGVGAFDELIDESKNGMLFDRGDVDDLEAKICRMMDDDQHLGRLSKEARASALDRMSLEVEAKDLVQIYRGQLDI